MLPVQEQLLARDQWDLLGQVAVEGASEEQVVEDGAAFMQVDLGVAELANLESPVEVH